MAIRVRGIGPIYWGLDRDHTGSRSSSYAWVVETTPPYRKSTWGHLFAIGRYALHFGFCVRETDPKEIARWEGEGLGVTPEEIAEWRGPSNPVLRTPAEWCDEFGVSVIDPDGWRGDLSLPWETPITETDFWRRAMVSTLSGDSHSWWGQS